MMAGSARSADRVSTAEAGTLNSSAEVTLLAVMSANVASSCTRVRRKVATS